MIYAEDRELIAEACEYMAAFVAKICEKTRQLCYEPCRSGSLNTDLMLALS